MLRYWLKATFLCLYVSSAVYALGESDDESDGSLVRVLQLVKKGTYVSRDFEAQLRNAFEGLLAQRTKDPWANGFTHFVRDDLFIEADGVPYRLRSMMTGQVTDLNRNPRFQPGRMTPKKGVGVPFMLSPMDATDFLNFWSSEESTFLPYGPGEDPDQDLVCTGVSTVMPVTVGKVGGVGVTEESVSGHSPMHYLFFHFRGRPTDGSYTSHQKLPARFPSTATANQMVATEHVSESTKGRTGSSDGVSPRSKSRASLNGGAGSDKRGRRGSGLGGARRKSPPRAGTPVNFATHALILGLEAVRESETSILIERFKGFPTTLSSTTLDGLLSPGRSPRHSPRTSPLAASQANPSRVSEGMEPVPPLRLYEEESPEPSKEGGVPKEYHPFVAAQIRRNIESGRSTVGKAEILHSLDLICAALKLSLEEAFQLFSGIKRTSHSFDGQYLTPISDSLLATIALEKSLAHSGFEREYVAGFGSLDLRVPTGDELREAVTVDTNAENLAGQLIMGAKDDRLLAEKYLSSVLFIQPSAARSLYDTIVNLASPRGAKAAETPEERGKPQTEAMQVAGVDEVNQPVSVGSNYPQTFKEAIPYWRDLLPIFRERVELLPEDESLPIPANSMPWAAGNIRALFDGGEKPTPKSALQSLQATVSALGITKAQAFMLFVYVREYYFYVGDTLVYPVSSDVLLGVLPSFVENFRPLQHYVNGFSRVYDLYPPPSREQFSPRQVDGSRYLFRAFKGDPWTFVKALEGIFGLSEKAAASFVKETSNSLMPQRPTTVVPRPFMLYSAMSIRFLLETFRHISLEAIPNKGPLMKDLSDFVDFENERLEQMRGERVLSYKRTSSALRAKAASDRDNGNIAGAQRAETLAKRQEEAYERLEKEERKAQEKADEKLRERATRENKTVEEIREADHLMKVHSLLKDSFLIQEGLQAISAILGISPRQALFLHIHFRSMKGEGLRFFSGGSYYPFAKHILGLTPAEHDQFYNKRGDTREFVKPSGRAFRESDIDLPAAQKAVALVVSATTWAGTSSVRSTGDAVVTLSKILVVSFKKAAALWETFGINLEQNGSHRPPPATSYAEPNRGASTKEPPVAKHRRLEAIVLIRKALQLGTVDYTFQMLQEEIKAIQMILQLDNYKKAALLYAKTLGNNLNSETGGAMEGFVVMGCDPSPDVLRRFWDDLQTKVGREQWPSFRELAHPVRVTEKTHRLREIPSKSAEWAEFVISATFLNRLMFARLEVINHPERGEIIQKLVGQVFCLTPHSEKSLYNMTMSAP